MTPRRRHPATAGRLVGLLLLGHWIAVVAIKCGQGRAAEVFWLSHLALGLTALAWLTGRDRLARTALTMIAVPHLLWLGDAAVHLLAGRSPLNITAYLTTAAPADWAATAHHFYLLPLLWLALRRRGGGCRADAAGAWLAIALGFVAARVFSDPQSNVNYAFGVFGAVRSPALDWINTLPPAAFAACYLLLAGALIVVPGSAIVTATTRVHLGSGGLHPSRGPASARPGHTAG